LKILNNYFLIYSLLEIFATIQYIICRTAKLSKREKIDIKSRQSNFSVKKIYYVLFSFDPKNFMISNLKKNSKNIESLKIIVACHLWWLYSVHYAAPGCSCCVHHSPM